MKPRTLSHALKQFRDAHSLTQAEAAFLLRRTIRTYQGYELGRRPAPDTERAIRQDMQTLVQTFRLKGKS